jgi:hypothetical protein
MDNGTLDEYLDSLLYSIYEEMLAKRAGACVAICNRDATPMDYLVDY